MNIIKIFLLLIIPLSACTKFKNYQTSPIYFLKEPTPKGEAYYGRAGISGKIIIRNGCFFLRDNFAKESLLIWPSDYDFRVINNEINIIDNNKKAFVKVGSFLKISGGHSSIESFNFNQIKHIKKCYLGGDVNVIWVGKQ